MTEPIVQVRGLRKRYGERTAVDGVDLDVQEGEIVGLLGANGAGKTTTVECLQGLRRRDGGSIRVLGLDPAVDGPKLRSLIGSQQQDSALPDRMRVAEAIELFRGPRTAAVDGLLSAFGLANRRRTPFSALSGGQRQRLFLVLALLNRPRLVVLDELTQGLDPAARRDVWDAIRALRDGGTTTLLVTHYMEEAEGLCDRVLVMRRRPGGRQRHSRRACGPQRPVGDRPVQLVRGRRPGLDRAARGPRRTPDRRHGRSQRRPDHGRPRRRRAGTARTGTDRPRGAHARPR